MNKQDFTTTLVVDATTNEVFRAITNLRGWWSAQIEGGTDKLNDECVYHYKNIHYSKLKLVELAPDEKVVWLVMDNYFKFTKDKSEWIGTRLVVDILRKDIQTEVTFTHEGLTQQYECYEVCREAWTNYINNSLRNLITTGKGVPSAKEDDHFDAQLVEKWKLEEVL